MPNNQQSLWKYNIWEEYEARWCCTRSIKHATAQREFFIIQQKYVRTHELTSVHTHRNTYMHTSHPIQTSLRSQHLPFSEPAGFNINYPQDIATLCMHTNTSGSIAVPVPHTPLTYEGRGCLVNLNPANPPLNLLLLLGWLYLLHFTHLWCW